MCRRPGEGPEWSLSAYYCRMLQTYLLVQYRIWKRENQQWRLLPVRQTGYNLRGHSYTLATTWCCLELWRNFFSQRVVKPWNKLLSHVVQHLQPTHLRIVSTHCRVGHYKAEALTYTCTCRRRNSLSSVLKSNSNFCIAHESDDAVPWNKIFDDKKSLNVVFPLLGNRSINHCWCLFFISVFCCWCKDLIIFLVLPNG